MCISALFKHREFYIFKAGATYYRVYVSNVYVYMSMYAVLCMRLLLHTHPPCIYMDKSTCKGYLYVKWAMGMCERLGVYLCLYLYLHLVLHIICVCVNPYIIACV